MAQVCMKAMWGALLALTNLELASRTGLTLHKRHDRVFPMNSSMVGVAWNKRAWLETNLQHLPW
eukprot:scaffold293843_cov21-Tisochrysis_lutea.AAC.1